jgi:hypothetical protein
MTAILEKMRNRLYEEKLLEIYSKKDSILDVLKCAYLQEVHYSKGAFLNSDTVLIKAKSDERTGLWEVTLEVDHGKVVYTCMDEDANNINIFSMPNDKYIKDKETLTEAEIKAIQIQASNSININLKDVRSLRKAKDLFKYDYVLKHIPLYHLDGDDAARFIIWHIKAYRKVFLDYKKTYSFLWEGTSYMNASALVKSLVERNLVNPAFFENIDENSKEVPGQISQEVK